ncbi:MAG: hypothetical protein IPO60_17620 [Flavobacteriales bacterium]|nr:hypothetical protein [Flavobacteriales bacterium]
MARMLRYLLFGLSFLIGTVDALAQRIDSIHVFKQLPPRKYTSASANAMAWKLYRSHVPCTVVKGQQMSTAGEAMKSYAPARHIFRDLPGLEHLAMGWSGGRPFTLAVADDMDLVINFTARTEYRISGMTDRIRVRALIARMMVE